MITQFVVSADGTRIAYDVAGHGPALMLLHGAGKSKKDWHTTGYVERLRSDFTVIAVDIRGSGESESLVNTTDYTIEKIHQDLEAVADVCRAPHFAIWGYSLGGNIARYVGAWSARVTAMTVVGIPFGPAVDDEFDRYIDQFARKYAPPGRVFAPSTAPTKKKSAIKGQIPALLACFQAMRLWPRIEPQDVRCPTLLLAGTKNTTAMSWVSSHRDTLPGTQVRVEIIEGLNHPQEFSQIDQVFPIVSSFFKRLCQAVPSSVVQQAR
jgi:pimeloyl-ACP methyl ester carboxylesterase